MAHTVNKSKELFDHAKTVIPGGVNSPVRSFNSVGGIPPFISRGAGCRVYDVDGNEYIDYVLSWGPLILGHAHPEIVDAATKAMENGSSFGAPTEREVILGSMVLQFFPKMDMIRLVSSGTEASMTAIRLARGYTKRDKIVKFSGCYHGHVDSLLAVAGSGAATLGIPATPGVTGGTARDTITLPFNDIDAVRAVFDDIGSEIAAVIVEPVVGNMGVVPPVEGFLDGLIQTAHGNGSLVIFDEVMSGFRVDRGGAQTLFDLSPDITLLGKVIGGGFPLGAVAGKSEIMEHLAPSGEVYQAGTLSGNPVAVAAGIATLTVLSRPGVFEDIAQQTKTLNTGVVEAAEKAGIALWAPRVGTMTSFFFRDKPVLNFADAKESKSDLFKRFFHKMLQRGVYLAPSPYEALFLSSAHTNTNIDMTIAAAEEAFRVIGN
jgi:glutamate-1-semialdehyde 2,1-aminomutase